MDDLYLELRSGAVQAARALLGWKLVLDSPEGRTAGYIVETEAYTEDDPASHTYSGKSQRNASMFEEAGTIYTYFTYGMHYCANIVTGEVGSGQGVLIRALEPIEGIEIMKKRRGTDSLRNLASGPAKLVQAMGITPEINGSVLGESLHIEIGIKPELITQSVRIGISKATEHEWRFYIAGNLFVSPYK